MRMRRFHQPQCLPSPKLANADAAAHRNKDGTRLKSRSIGAVRPLGFVQAAIPPMGRACWENACAWSLLEYRMVGQQHHSATYPAGPLSIRRKPLRWQTARLILLLSDDTASHTVACGTTGL